MLTKDKFNILADFFLDGAKIIFASLVVGIFVPGAAAEVPWIVFLTGIGITIFFLSIAVIFSKQGAANQ